MSSVEGRRTVQLARCLTGLAIYAQLPGSNEESENRSLVNKAADEADLIDDVFAAFGSNWNEDPHPLDDIDAKFGTWFDDER